MDHFELVLYRIRLTCGAAIYIIAVGRLFSHFVLGINVYG